MVLGGKWGGYGISGRKNTYMALGSPVEREDGIFEPLTGPLRKLKLEIAAVFKPKMIFLLDIPPPLL
jgi:hypothetical protein